MRHRPVVGTGLRIGLFVLALCIAAAPLRGAQAPTRVTVQAKLAAERFRVRFGVRTTAIEDSIAAQFAATLTEKLGFVRFFASDTTAVHRLVFTLDRRERGATGPFPEYGFWARLERPDGDPIELYWMTLRPPEAAAQGIGTEALFLDEVATRLAHAEIEPIRTELLRNVPIAMTALAWENPPGWALPLPRDSLCMRRFTLLEIVNAFTVNAIVVDRPYQARVVSGPFTVSSPQPEHLPFLRKLFSEPATPEAKQELIEALHSGSVQVKEVYVVDYQHDPIVCRRPVGPQAANPGGGS